MSGPATIPPTANVDRVPLPLQLAAWLAGLAACLWGMLDGVAEWAPALATVQLIALAIAPIVFMLPRQTRARPGTRQPAPANGWDWLLCLLLGCLSLSISGAIGSRIGDAPPAYHDEFSYLFQAKTLLAGRFSFPSHPLHPELFDQVHVLNEGRMASRYYPGTGLWLAPFVAAGYPYLAPWIAGALSTMLIFRVGRETADRRTGVFAGLAMALSPGMGLFGNTLLSHHPTLLGLSVFLLGVTRWRRTRSSTSAWMAGAGLSFAMLCRPLTAAAVGLPFGVDVVAWLVQNGRISRKETQVPAGHSGKTIVATVAGFGIPLVLGWAIMLAYNESATGDWFRSPYQLYTDIYTPRHVYGFNNVVRGERHVGPKVIDAYDRWAENLTPELAARNLLTRWVASWTWTLDCLPLLLASVIVLGMLPRLDRRWLLMVLAIASLHLAHLPYWYTGIMGWHYVFESAPLWCLILGGASSLLLADWTRRGQPGLRLWWCGLLVISVAGIYAAPGGLWPARLTNGLNALAYPRQRHLQLRTWLESRIQRPALVLIEQEAAENVHLDLVVNDPGLNSDLLLGRYRTRETDAARIHRDFPDRHVYIANPYRQTIKEIP